MIRLLYAAGLLAGAAGPVAASDVGGATAQIRTADGRLVGRAFIPVGPNRLEVRVEARGLAPGRYGVHLHAVGRCEGPDFASAGPHWDPTGLQHGRLNPRGHHRGDLPNLVIGADGSGQLMFVIDGTRGRESLFDTDGATIVIHAAADDERTDPSGNSGARTACGVLGR